MFGMEKKEANPNEISFKKEIGFGDVDIVSTTIKATLNENNLSLEKIRKVLTNFKTKPKNEEIDYRQIDKVTVNTFISKPELILAIIAVIIFIASLFNIDEVDGGIWGVLLSLAGVVLMAYFSYCKRICIVKKDASKTSILCQAFGHKEEIEKFTSMVNEKIKI